MASAHFITAGLSAQSNLCCRPNAVLCSAVQRSAPGCRNIPFRSGSARVPKLLCCAGSMLSLHQHGSMVELLHVDSACLVKLLVLLHYCMSILLVSAHMHGSCGLHRVHPFDSTATGCALSAARGAGRKPSCGSESLSTVPRTVAPGITRNTVVCGMSLIQS